MSTVVYAYQLRMHYVLTIMPETDPSQELMNPTYLDVEELL